MKLGFLQAVIILLAHVVGQAQNVENTYRFDGDFAVASPACAQNLVIAKAPGACSTGSSLGGFILDNIGCQATRTVYHSNLNDGLMYANTEGTVGETYTIQMYLKNTNWGRTRSRIIDFSNGQVNDGVYFKNVNGSANRCIDFYPAGISGTCPFFELDKYYLLTITRNGQTGIVDVYVDNKLFISYNDINKKYVGKAGVPIYIFRDDSEVPCESGEANFAYLSFTNYYSSQTNVSKAYEDRCSIVNINDASSYLINPNPSCGNKEIKVAYTGTLPADGYTFKWDFDGAKILSGSGRGPYSLRWSTAGVKQVTLSVTNNVCGKTINNTKPTIVSFNSVSTTINDSQCNGNATLTINPIAGISPFTYSIDSVNFLASNVFAVIAKDYKVFVKDYNGCLSDTIITVSLPGTIQLKTMSDTTICIGQKIQLLTTGNVNKYTWSPALGLDDTSIKEPFAEPEQTTQYIVTARDKSCVLSDTIKITVIPEIQLIVTPDANIAPNKPYQLNVSSPQLTGMSRINYIWSPSYGLNNPNIQNPKATLVSSQLYTITLSTIQGCNGTGNVMLTVVPPALITLPDAFTPDGDGKNERLIPIAKSITSLNYLRIYNRWGEVIYSSKQLNEGWDGKIKGVNSESGSYVYKMEAVTDGGEVIVKNGTVLLIR